MAVVFTPEARKYLTPLSVEDLPKRKAKDDAAAFADLKAALVRFGPRKRRSDPELAEALAEADALAALEAPPTQTPSTLALAVLLRVTWMRGDAGRSIGFAAKRLGPAGVLEALIEASSMELDHVPSGEVLVSRRPVRRPLLESSIDEIVIRASDEERAAVESLVRARWEGAPLPARLVMSEALVHRADLANTLVDDWIASTPRDSEGWRLLVARVDDLDAATRLVAEASSATVVDLVRRFGERALPMLASALESAKDAHAFKHLARAVSLYDDAVAAHALGEVSMRSGAQPFVLDFFSKHPEHAESALGPHAKGKSRGAQSVAEILARVRRSASARDGEASLGTDTRAPTRAAKTDDVSAAESVPACLRTPVWASRGRATASTVLDAPTIAFARTLIPDPVVDALRRTQLDVDRERPFDAEAAAAFVTAVRDPSPSLSVRGRWTQLPPALAIDLYTHWPTHRLRWHGMAEDAIVWLGADALAGLVAHATHAMLRDEHAPQWALRVVAPEMALALLAGADDPTHAPLVGDWLDAHRDAAVAGLVPIAVGPAGAPRALAERGVIEIARRHGDAFVREASAGLSTAIGAAIDDLLARRVAAAGPPRAPKLGATFRADELPPVRVRGGRATLSADEITTLAIYLSRSGHALEHPALAEVRRACEPRDLAELAWTLARGWELGGARTRDAWMIDALVSLARDDDDVVRRVLPNLKKDRALDVLATIGSDAAAMELLGATTRGHKTFHAKSAIARIARRRGLAHDDLVETLAPSFLEGRAMRFEHGGEGYTLELDEHFELVLRDASDRVTKRLPTVAAPSDADARAHSRIAEIKADVAMLVEKRLQLMERRMIDARALSREELEARYHGHPLWAPLARRLLWAFHLGTTTDPSGTFRIAEDGSFADEHDRPITLPAFATFGIPHPWRLRDDLRQRWATLFHDYAIVQPFPQLGRSLSRPTESELAEAKIVRTTGVAPNGEGGGALEVGVGFEAHGTMTHRMDLGRGVYLHAAITMKAPHVLTLTATGAARGRPATLAAVGALRVAEYLAFFGAV